MGYVLGSEAEKTIDKYMPKARKCSYEGMNEILLALQNDRIDAYIDFDLLYKFHSLDDPSLIVVPSSLPSKPSGFALPKGSSLKGSLDGFLKDIQDSGLNDEIYNRWLFHNDESKMPGKIIQRHV